MRDLLWILLAFQLCHDLEPVGHLFAVALFDIGEVGFARRILRHVVKGSGHVEVATNFVGGLYLQFM